MKRASYVLLWLLYSAVHAAPLDDAKAYLLLGDPRSALHIAQVQKSQDEKSDDLQWRLIELRAIADMGDKEALIKAFSALPDDLRSDPAILDIVGWGVIEWGARRPEDHVRRMALIGSAMSRRERGARITEQMLSDASAQLRALAAHLASFLGDESLISKMTERLEVEKSGFVRPELIRALGQTRARASRGALEHLLSDSSMTEEESALVEMSLAAIGASSRAKGEIKEEIEEGHQEEADDALFKSKVPGLRAHAAHMCALEEEGREQVAKLIADPVPTVRASALFALYTLSHTEQEIAELTSAATDLLKDPSPAVQLVAAKVLMPYEPKKAAEPCLEQITSRRVDLARKSAALLAQSGAQAAPALREALARVRDPLAKLNLALGASMHGIKGGEKVAIEAIESTLKEPHCKLVMHGEGGLFEVITERLGAFSFQTEEGDLAVRLQLLDRLAHLDYARAAALTGELLRPRQWGTLLSCAFSWLKHRPDRALDLIESHLKSEDWTIRVQAALMLTHLRGDPQAREVLLAAFKEPTIPRSAKLMILEGMLQIDARGHIGLFTELLTSPYEAMQVVAAGCLVTALER